jgi:hypothetical protein
MGFPNAAINHKLELGFTSWVKRKRVRVRILGQEKEGQGEDLEPHKEKKT